MSSSRSSNPSARIDDVERRLHAVEERLHLLDSSPAHLSAPTDDDFYALEGVKRTMPDGGVVYAGALSPESAPVEWQVQMTADEVMSMDWSLVSSALAALGSPVRARLMQAILAGAANVGELSGLSGMGTTGQLYHHLGQLTSAGWLRSEGRGRYAVPADRIVPLMAVMAAAARP